MTKLDPAQVDGFPGLGITRRTLTVCSPGWETSIVPASISENLSHDPVAQGFSSTVRSATSTTANAAPDSAAIEAVTLYLPG